MRNLFLAILFNSTLYLFADGPRLAFIQLELTFKNGKTQTKNFMISEDGIAMDSLSNQKYLLKSLLRRLDHNDNDTLECHNDWVSFEDKSHHQPTIVQFYKEDRILRNKVASVKFKKIHLQSGGIGLVNNLRASDSIWMKTRPVETIEVSGFLCDYTFHMFEHNAKLKAQITALKKFIEKIETDDIYNDNNKLYHKIKKFNHPKLVIVCVCSC